MVLTLLDFRIIVVVFLNNGVLVNGGKISIIFHSILILKSVVQYLTQNQIFILFQIILIYINVV